MSEEREYEGTLIEDYMKAHDDEDNAADRLLTVEEMLAGDLEGEEVDEDMRDINGIFRDVILVVMNISTQMQTTENLIQSFMEEQDGEGDGGGEIITT